MNQCKKAIALVSVLLWGLGGFGQKNDYVWLQGYTFSPKGYDTSQGQLFGTTVMNFNYNPFVASFDTFYKMNFDETNVSYCDSNGNLLFYANGQYVENSLDDDIEGSDSINGGNYWNEWYPN